MSVAMMLLTQRRGWEWKNSCEEDIKNYIEKIAQKVKWVTKNRVTTRKWSNETK